MIVEVTPDEFEKSSRGIESSARLDDRRGISPGKRVMADRAAWSVGYARQARADLQTFEQLQAMSVPECHKLQFLQMACEKLVKAHLCSEGSDPADLQASHAYVARTLPVVLRQHAGSINYGGPAARTTLNRARLLAAEIEVLAPAVTRNGQRPDNCEYPWEDAIAELHVPLDWTFASSQLLVQHAGRMALKLIVGAIDSLLA